MRFQKALGASTIYTHCLTDIEGRPVKSIYTGYDVCYQSYIARKYAPLPLPIRSVYTCLSIYDSSGAKTGLDINGRSICFTPRGMVATPAVPPMPAPVPVLTPAPTPAPVPTPLPASVPVLIPAAPVISETTPMNIVTTTPPKPSYSAAPAPAPMPSYSAAPAPTPSYSAPAPSYSTPAVPPDVPSLPEVAPESTLPVKRPSVSPSAIAIGGILAALVVGGVVVYSMQRKK